MRPTKMEQIDDAIAMMDKEFLKNIPDVEALSHLLTTAGQAKAFKIMYEQNFIVFLIMAKRIKDSTLHKRTGMNWGQFCERVLGVSTRKMDEDLANLAHFGAEHLESLRKMGLGYRDLKAMKALPEGSMRFGDDGFVEIDGEKLQVNPENIDAIRDAVERIQERAKEKVSEAASQAAEAEANLKAAREIIADKNMQVLELQKAIEKPHLKGPHEIVDQIENLYGLFKTAQLALDAFPVEKLVPYDKAVILLRSFLQAALGELTMYVYAFDQRFYAIAPEPEDVHEYLEKLKALNEEDDVAREERREERRAERLQAREEHEEGAPRRAPTMEI